MATINIKGNGGIIEGDLGATDITVNMDSALYFDGTGDAIVVAHSTDFNPGTGAFSVAFWVNMDTGTSEQHVVCKRNSGR